MVTDLTISEVAVLQAVKIDVVKSGAKVAKYNASIVAKRDALVRVYVAPGSGYQARALTGELRLEDNGATKVLVDTKTMTAASTDDALASTFDFDVSGDLLTKTTKFSVAVRDPQTGPQQGQTGGAQYPADGTTDSLGAESTGDQLKVVVVPVQYGADGSNRVPDTGAAQLETYRQAMYGFYPAAKIDLTVRAPFPYSSAISASGTGFSTVLQAVQNLRQQDGVSDDVYYYGAFMPAASFATYCGSGCVTGLSSVGSSPQDSLVRASVGIGFTGQESAITMAHELGHAHGRLHSPCGGASGPDPNYPYSGGGIGVQGYDLNKKALVPASTGKDLMGYCQPEWISDYTYQALVDRMQYVNNASGAFGAYATPQTFRYVDVAADGSASWGADITLRARPWGEEHDVTFTASDGSVLGAGTAYYYAYDHLPGGFALVPAGPSTASRVAIKGLAGRAVTSLVR